MKDIRDISVLAVLVWGWRKKVLGGGRISQNVFDSSVIIQLSQLNNPSNYLNTKNLLQTVRIL